MGNQVTREEFDEMARSIATIVAILVHTLDKGAFANIKKSIEDQVQGDKGLFPGLDDKDKESIKNLVDMFEEGIDILSKEV